MDDKAKNIIRKIIKEELDAILEASPYVDKLSGPAERKPVVTLPQKQKAVDKTNINTDTTAKPVKKQIVKKPVKTAADKELDTKRSRPEKPTVASNVLAQSKYQIFITKLRMNKLDVNELVNRLVESLHDYDVNISKNETDLKKINSYVLPVIGSIDAIKNGVESLKLEFEKLKNLTNGHGNE